MKGNTEKMPEERKLFRAYVKVSMPIYAIASAIAILGFYSAEVKFGLGRLAVFGWFLFATKILLLSLLRQHYGIKMARLNFKAFICPNCEQEIGQNDNCPYNRQYLVRCASDISWQKTKILIGYLCYYCRSL